MKELLIATLAVSASVSLAAFDPTGYVVQTKVDTASHSSLTNGDYWKPEGVPEKGKSYYAPAQYGVFTPSDENSTYDFPGDELAIAGEFRAYLKSGNDFNMGNLRMFHGSTFWPVCTTVNNGTVHGTLTVDPEQLGNSGVEGVRLWFRRNASSLNELLVIPVDFDWVGPAAANVLIRPRTDFSKYRPLAIGLNGDLTRFEGVFRVETLEEVGTNTVLQLGTSDLAGKIEVGDQAVFRRVADVPNKVGGLKLEAGSRLEVAKDALLTITSSYVCEKGAILDLHPLNLPTAISKRDGASYAVLRLASAVQDEFDTSAFTLVYDKNGPFPGVELSVVSEPDGARTLYVVLRPIVSISKVTQSVLEATETGKDYYIPNSSSASARQLYGMTNGVFNGETLYLGYAYNFVGTGAGETGIYVKNLYLAGESSCNLYGVDDTFSIRDRRSYYLRGGITIDPEYAGTWLCRSERLLYVESELFGSGDIPLYSVDRSNSKTKAAVTGFCEFTALNTNYTGRILATAPYTGTTTGEKVNVDYPNENVMLTLYVTDGRNLGGPLAGFTYDALTLSGWSKLAATNSVVFDQTNRGVLVRGVGQVEVTAGDTIAFKNPLTLAGELVKQGAGTLALGGSLRFIDGEVTTAPLAGTNVITVKEGWIKPLATNALDGAALAFATGTGLRLDLAPTAEGLAECGLVNVKALGSVGQTAGATGKIALAFDGTPIGDVTLGVATLSSKSAAEALRALLKPVRPRGFAVALSVDENDDGTATVKATLSPVGMALFIR